MIKISNHHNFDCFKSQAALGLFKKNDVSPEIIYYLEAPPDTEVLNSPIGKIALQLHIWQRTISIKDGKAIIAKPPENILRLIGE